MKKKIFVIIFISLFVVGCGSHNKQNNPTQVLNAVIKKDYNDSKVLCEKSEKDYYAALLENEKEISLILLEKNKNNSYEFFGSSSYSKEKDNFGKYMYGDDNTMIVVFSKNTKEYSKLSLTFDNLKKENETASIDSKIDKNAYIINFFTLPSDYTLKHIELD